MNFDETHHTWTDPEYAHGDDGGYLAYLAQVEAYEQAQKATAPDGESEAV